MSLVSWPLASAAIEERLARAMRDSSLLAGDFAVATADAQTPAEAMRVAELVTEAITVLEAQVSAAMVKANLLCGKD